MNFINELINRYRTESPAFFVTIQNISVALFSVATLILTIPAVINSATTLTIDLGFVNTAAQYVLAASAVMGAVAKAAVKDPSKI